MKKILLLMLILSISISQIIAPVSFAESGRGDRYKKKLETHEKYVNVTVTVTREELENKMEDAYLNRRGGEFLFDSFLTISTCKLNTAAGVVLGLATNVQSLGGCLSSKQQEELIEDLLDADKNEFEVIYQYVYINRGDKSGYYFYKVIEIDSN